MLSRESPSHPFFLRNCSVKQLLLGITASLVFVGCATDVVYTTPTDQARRSSSSELTLENPSTQSTWYRPGDVIAYLTQRHSTALSGEYLFAPISGGGGGVYWTPGIAYPVVYYADWKGQKYRVVDSGKRIPGVSDLGMLAFLVFVDAAGTPKYGMYHRLDASPNGSAFNPGTYKVSPDSFRLKPQAAGVIDDGKLRYAVVYKGKDGALMQYAIQDLQRGRYLSQGQIEAAPGAILPITKEPSHSIMITEVSGDAIKVRATSGP